MDIGTPIRDLGEIDAQPLIDQILALDDQSWNENLSRQEMFDVHKKTSSLVMVFCDGSVSYTHLTLPTIYSV